jgi:phenylacetate-coenzyme A ligase PaaK-like adenylate-forming protein
MQTRRFRSQARRAQRETTYYAQLFEKLAVDPGQLTYDGIASLPCTPRAAIQEAPGDFVSRSERPVWIASSSGSTGRPVSVAFSEHELHMFASLSALGFLMSNDLHPDDVFYLAAGSGIATYTLERVCRRVGVEALAGGGRPVDEILCQLAAARRKPTVLHAPPSLLGALLETGRSLGYGPRNFSLERILTGGESLTCGLRDRLKSVFGEVKLTESYGMTETFGVGGQVCADGHLHFHPAHGLIEVIDPDTHGPVGSDGIGTLIVTPLPPFRDTTLLLRYETQDLVRIIAEPLTCEQRWLPAVSRVLGKRSLSIRHADGWTFPRDVLEALEAIEDIPLPARCGIWQRDNGVGVEVVARSDSAVTHRRVSDALEARALPVRELHVVTDRAELQHALPLRHAA